MITTVALSALGLLGQVAAVTPAPRAPAAETLRRQIVEHERDALRRSPALVASKLKKMSRDRYAFFRGTSWLTPSLPSAFVPKGTDSVALMGDPHIENVGTFTTGAGVRILDFNDFDLARFGPYVDDLRRLALSFWIAADMGELGRKPRAKVVRALVEGYVAEIESLAAGRAPFSLSPRDVAWNGALDQVLVDPAEQDDPDATPATPEEVQLVREILARYPRTLHAPTGRPAAFFAIKRVVRVAAGIASLPLPRFRVTVEGATAKIHDDRVLDVKESQGALPAQQIVTLQRRFQEFADDDPLLGWATAGSRQFRLRELSADQRRLDLSRIVRELESPRWKKRDMRELALALGRLLARGHARAPGADAAPGLGVLVGAVGKRALLIAGETVEVVEALGDSQRETYRTFKGLLEMHGPLLGWSPQDPRDPQNPKNP